MEQHKQRKPLFLVEDLETLKVITDPLRLQILELLDREPRTVSDVAEKIGLSPSRLYYHFNLLEKHGFISVVETRMVSNMLEKLYWMTADDVEIDKSLLDFSKNEVQEGLVSLVTSSLDATRAEMLRSLQARSYNLEKGAKPVPRDVILHSMRKRLSDETYQRFILRLRELLEEFDRLPEETRSGDDVNDFSLACYLFPNFYYQDEAQKDGA